MVFKLLNIYSKVLVTVGVVIFILSLLFEIWSFEIMAVFLILSGIILARDNFVNHHSGVGLWIYYGLLFFIMAIVYFMWFV